MLVLRSGNARARGPLKGTRSGRRRAGRGSDGGEEGRPAEALAQEGPGVCAQRRGQGTGQRGCGRLPFPGGASLPPTLDSPGSLPPGRDRGRGPGSSAELSGARGGGLPRARGLPEPSPSPPLPAAALGFLRRPGLSASRAAGWVWFPFPPLFSLAFSPSLPLSLCPPPLPSLRWFSLQDKKERRKRTESMAVTGGRALILCLETNLFPKALGGGPPQAPAGKHPRLPSPPGVQSGAGTSARGGTAAAGLGPGVRTSENWRPTSESGSLSPGPCDCDVTGALDGPERELAGQ